LPANDHSCRISPPTTNGPGWATATADGPALHFSLPSTSSVALGRLIEGPMPKVTGPLATGEIQPV
jgi:hypothetical protein